MNISYEAINVKVTSQRTFFTTGCSGVVKEEVIDQNFHGKNVLDIIKKFGDWHYINRSIQLNQFKLNVNSENGRIDITLLTDYDFYPLSNDEIELWKQGNFAAYQTVFTLYVQKIIKQSVKLDLTN